MELLGRDPQLASAMRAIGDVRRGSGRVLGLVGETGLGKSALLAEIGARAQRGGPAGPRRTRLGARARRPVRVDRRCARGDRGRAGRGARGGALPAPPRRRGAAAGARADRGPARRPALGRRGLRRARPAPAAAPRRGARAAGDRGARRSAPRRGCWTPRAARRAGSSWSSSRSRTRMRSRWSPVWQTPRCVSGSCAKAAGNPLFLSELARVADRGDGALPATLVAAVSFEVAALAHEPRALIQGAAVAGEPFDPELAAAIAGLDPASAPRGARRPGRRRPRPPGPRERRSTCWPAPRTARGALAGHRRVDDVALRRAAGPDLVPPAAAGRAFVFRHPLVRRAVYDACAPGWRLGRTSAPPPRWRRAAPGPRRARTTSCARRTWATRTRSRC